VGRGLVLNITNACTGATPVKRHLAGDVLFQAGFAYRVGLQEHSTCINIPFCFESLRTAATKLSSIPFTDLTAAFGTRCGCYKLTRLFSCSPRAPTASLFLTPPVCNSPMALSQFSVNSSFLVALSNGIPPCDRGLTTSPPEGGQPWMTTFS